jgi:hypothetical protein
MSKPLCFNKDPNYTHLFNCNVILIRSKREKSQSGCHLWQNRMIFLPKTAKSAADSGNEFHHSRHCIWSEIRENRDIEQTVWCLPHLATDSATQHSLHRRIAALITDYCSLEQKSDNARHNHRSSLHRFACNTARAVHFA